MKQSKKASVAMNRVCRWEKRKGLEEKREQIFKHLSALRVCWRAHCVSTDMEGGCR
jgi:hypothetical protein